MSSDSETPVSFFFVVLRAVLYALAVALLVLYWPSEPHVFIYQGF